VLRNESPRQLDVTIQLRGWWIHAEVTVLDLLRRRCSGKDGLARRHADEEWVVDVVIIVVVAIAVLIAAVAAAGAAVAAAAAAAPVVSFARNKTGRVKWG